MKANKKIIGFVLIIIILAAILFFSHKDSSFIKIAGQDIKIEIADTEAEQAQGLSGRKELQENEGMLFVFAKPGKYSFWMKDMNFAIDMIWLDENMKVVYIKNNATPESYPESFGPAEDAKYVLEVVSGFVEKNNLKAGDIAELNF